MTGVALALMAADAASAGFTATASPPALSSGSSTNTFTTSATTAIPAGGSGSYTYAWSVLIDDFAHGFAINSPASASTTVTITGILAGDYCSATIECVVVDTNGGSSTSVGVEVSHQDGRVPL